jgi:hypothetical protein
LVGYLTIGVLAFALAGVLLAFGTLGGWFGWFMVICGAIIAGEIATAVLRPPDLTSKPWIAIPLEAMTVALPVFGICALFGRAGRKYDHHHQQVVAALRRLNGQASTDDIAQITELRPSRVNLICDLLERQGIVNRGSRSDSTHWTLTTLGNKSARQADSTGTESASLTT